MWTYSQIPECHVTDAPRYAYRGVLIDVARNFQSKEKIYRYYYYLFITSLSSKHYEEYWGEHYWEREKGRPRITFINHRYRDVSV